MVRDKNERSRLMVVAVPLLALAALVQQTDEDFYEVVVSLGIALFVLLPMIALIVWVTRALVKRKVDRLMIMKSEAQRSEALPELQAAEVQATRAPEFVTLEAASERGDAVAKREALVAKDRALLARGVRRDLLAAFGYFLVSRIDPPTSALAPLSQEAPQIIAAALGFLSVVRYLVWSWESKAEKSTLVNLARFLAVWPPIRPAKPEWRPHVSVIAIAFAVWAAIASLVKSDFLLGLGLLLAAAFHAWLNASLLASTRSDQYLKLVVLRVFGIDETATFTFKGLLRHWKHFGTFFTVVDPSFLKSEHQRRSLLFEFLVFLFFLLVILSIEIDAFANNPVLFVAAGVLPVTLVLGVGYGLLSLRQVDRDFVRSRDELVERLRRLDARPRALDLTFRSMPMMCYDNVWKIAVSECVKTSDAVLMDLRGFSEERKGCTYEVDYLLDVVPIDRVVFLVEPEFVPRVQKLIVERWEFLRTTSPNLELEDPQARIYVTSKKDDRDIQGILDVLLSVAHTPRAA